MKFNPMAVTKGVVSGLLLAAAMVGTVGAKDLGIEGQIFEPIEEDFRVIIMRLIARQDISESTKQLEQSARDYTKNLPAYFLPRAEATRTHWKDVGIIVTEDIYLPWVEWETGSVFEPEQVLAVKAGTYLNPIAKLPAAGIERLFVFDPTDYDQMVVAKDLMRQKVYQLSFMAVAGDPGLLAEEMQMPVYHPTPSMLEKFSIKALPSLVGFGRGPHQGHMAVTEFKVGADTVSDVKKAWFGLPYQGYDPEALSDVDADPNSPMGSKDFMSKLQEQPALSLPIAPAPEITQPAN